MCASTPAGVSTRTTAIVRLLGAWAAGHAVLLAVLGSTAFAFLIGLVIVRVPGIAFGMLTLAIGQMAYLGA